MLKVSSRLFPIGFIISVDAPNFNPNDFYIGGNWERVKGRVIVGVDEAQSEFNVTGKTGGSKTHTLTEAELASHVHLFTNKYGNVNTGSTWAALSNYNNSQAPSTSPLSTQPTGSGQPHNNLPPYQTAFVWKLISYSN